jgi:hypothetical protein
MVADWTWIKQGLSPESTACHENSLKFKHDFSFIPASLAF